MRVGQAELCGEGLLEVLEVAEDVHPEDVAVGDGEGGVGADGVVVPDLNA